MSKSSLRRGFDGSSGDSAVVAIAINFKITRRAARLSRPDIGSSQEDTTRPCAPRYRRATCVDSTFTNQHGRYTGTTSQLQRKSMHCTACLNRPGQPRIMTTAVTHSRGVSPVNNTSFCEANESLVLDSFDFRTRPLAQTRCISLLQQHYHGFLWPIHVIFTAAIYRAGVRTLDQQPLTWATISRYFIRVKGASHGGQQREDL